MWKLSRKGVFANAKQTKVFLSNTSFVANLFEMDIVCCNTNALWYRCIATPYINVQEHFLLAVMILDPIHFDQHIYQLTVKLKTKRTNNARKCQENDGNMYSIKQ